METRECAELGWHDCPKYDGRRAKHGAHGATVRPAAKPEAPKVNKADLAARMAYYRDR